MRGVLRFLGIVFVCLASIGAMAQAASSELHVSVKDPSGSEIRNATVTVRNADKNIERNTTQNVDGEYQFLQLPPGQYDVTVEAAGFAKTTVRQVQITVGQRATLPVDLKLASASETVNVNTETQLVQTEETSVNTTVGQKRIDNLPINGRNYINFTLTNSQVARDNAPSLGAAPTSGLNISGQRGRSNLVVVNGADYTDNATNGVRSTVSQEAVQEFQLITNGYAPEYGRASGGVVNIVTKTGSNVFHGDVFGYLRNRNLQAVNPFSTVPDPAYTRWQAGTAFGGAIKKDKTFYYFSYEVTDRHETGFSSIGNNGFGLVNFDASPYFGAPAGTFPIQITSQQAQFLAAPPPGIPAQTLAAYAFMAGASSGIAVNGKYPASFAFLPAALVPAGLQQFPSSCNPAFAATAGFTPYCTGLPASFQTLQSQIGNFPVYELTSLYSLRLDQQFTINNHLSLMGNLSPSKVTGIEENGQDQTFGQNAYSRTSQQNFHDFSFVADDSWVISNNKVNDFRFQYARRGLLYSYSSAPGGADPAVNIPGYAFFGREPYSYIDRTEQRYQFTDNFSWTKGSHNMKFGGDFNYIPTSATFTVNYGGVYDFGAQNIFPAPFPAFNAVQAYGLGIPQDFVQGIGNPSQSFRNMPLGVYWQDSWRIRPGLTMNYGLRYDIEFPPSFAPPDALAQAGYNMLGIQKGINADTTMFQPRLGIAWDPWKDGKTVLRGSGGIFYDHPLLGLYFLGQASDGSSSGQLAFPSTGFCNLPGGAPYNPANLNGIPIFQGNLTTAPTCAPGPPSLVSSLGYLPNQQQFNAFLPNSLFINQNYIAAGFPLAFQPFGYPLSKGFVYGRSYQANASVEHDLGGGFALNLTYSFNGGRHLNRPINANTSRGDLLVNNLRNAVAAGINQPIDSPLNVSGCGVNPDGTAYVPAALVNFFRPSGLNPSIANAYLAQPGGAQCVGLAQQVLKVAGLNADCDPTTLSNCVPFGDMDANYSNGSSVYHGFTANLQKRFSNKYEFLASYTWSHAIDDSTDLQATLAPQDSYYPNLERSNSTFDQRHRFVFSGVYQTGKLGGESAWAKLFSNFTLSALLEFSSGRPFLIITGDDTNFQLASNSARPSPASADSGLSACGVETVASKYSSTGYLQEPCYVPYATPGGPTPTLLALDGSLGRNAGTMPWTAFNDFSISRQIFFSERVSTQLRVDMFNLANRFNVSGVNVLWTGAGQPTAAYDPRQFQLAMKVVW